MDNVQKAYTMLDRIKLNHSEHNRDKDFMTHTIQSLRLEMAKLQEYEQEIVNENLELGRLVTYS